MNDVMYADVICLMAPSLAALQELFNIIIIHNERELFDLNARVEARGTIVPTAANIART